MATILGITKLHGCYRLHAGKTYAKVFWLLVMICAGSVFTEIAAQLLYMLYHRKVDTQACRPNVLFFTQKFPCGPEMKMLCSGRSQIAAT